MITKPKNTKKEALFLILLLISVAGVIILTPGLLLASPANGNENNNLSGASSTKTLTVYAAASLTEAFEEIGTQFEIANQGVKLNLSFAGSQILRTQIEQGATVDVFASADQETMDRLASQNLIIASSVKYFATNRLVVILPPSNPARISDLVDLARPNLRLVLADASVPAGNYTRKVLENLSKDPGYGQNFMKLVMQNVVSDETDVRQVVTKVELGEADAGFAYVTDAVSAPSLMRIEIPKEVNIIATYPIAILASSRNQGEAVKFIEFVTSAAGQKILSAWGFTPGQ